MATITNAVNIFNTTAGNKSAAATAFAVNDLIVVVAIASGTLELDAKTTLVSDDNAGGGGGTYTKIVESASGASPVISIWVRDGLITGTAATVITATQALSNGGGLNAYAVAGMSRVGSNAVKQSDSDNGLGLTTPTATLAAAMLTDNAGIGGIACSTNPPAVTPPTGWTEVEGGYITPTTGREVIRRNSGETGSTITWGSTVATAWVSALIELDTSSPATATKVNVIVGGI